MLIYLQMIEEPRDKRKFQRLHDRYLGLMLFVARRVLGNEQDAEDAVQEAFCAIAKNISNIFSCLVSLWSISTITCPNISQSSLLSP